MQLFSKAADTVFRTSIVGGVLLLCAAIGAMLAIARSPYMTNQYVTIPQPVPFSHQHHVADIGIDCRYCHQGPPAKLLPDCTEKPYAGE